MPDHALPHRAARVFSSQMGDCQTMKLFVAGVAFICSFAVLAQESGIVTRPSKYSVAETMDRVEAAIKGANGIQIFARIDFQAVAAAQGGKVRPSQLLIFGRGAVLEPLLPQYP